MIASNICYGLSPLYLYIFLYVLDLKIVGVAIVFFLGEFIGSMILLFYIKNDIKTKKE